LQAIAACAAGAARHRERGRRRTALHGVQAAHTDSDGGRI
jgi:hypothetical protein